MLEKETYLLLLTVRFCLFRCMLQSHVVNVLKSLTDVWVQMITYNYLNCDFCEADTDWAGQVCFYCKSFQAIWTEHLPCWISCQLQTGISQRIGHVPLTKMGLDCTWLPPWIKHTELQELHLTDTYDKRCTQTAMKWKDFCIMSL